MNLFIAGTDQAYEQAQELSQAAFMQERASICLQCLFRPAMPWKVRRRRLTWLLIAFVSIPIWILMLMRTSLSVLAPSTFLLAATIVGDACLMRHPWKKASQNLRCSRLGLDGQEQLEQRCEAASGCNPKAQVDEAQGDPYLWICHRADYDETDYWPSDANTTGLKLEGRVSSLKRDYMLRSKRITSELGAVRRRTEGFQGNVQSLQREVRDLGARVTSVEKCMGERLHHIEGATIRMEQSLKLLVEAGQAKGDILGSDSKGLGDSLHRLTSDSSNSMPARPAFASSLGRRPDSSSSIQRFPTPPAVRPRTGTEPVASPSSRPTASAHASVTSPAITAEAVLESSLQSKAAAPPAPASPEALAAPAAPTAPAPLMAPSPMTGPVPEPAVVHQLGLIE